MTWEQTEKHLDEGDNARFVIDKLRQELKDASAVIDMWERECAKERQRIAELLPFLWRSKTMLQTINQAMPDNEWVRQIDELIAEIKAQLEAARVKQVNQ